MASTSGKNLFCFIHIGGKFVNGGEDDIRYVGGSVRTRIIREGTTYEELRRMILSIIGEGSNEIILKFTVTFDKSTFVDLVDDDGVEHLIKFNGESGHVYVENGKNDNREETVEDAMEDDNENDRMFTSEDGLSMCQPTPSYQNEETPSLACAIPLIPTPTSETNFTKWKGAVIGVGQTFPDAVTLRETLYKYSVSHKFSYKFIKNNRQKIIVKCKVEGCPWYMGAYSMGEQQDTEFLTIKTYTSEHIHDAQDNLIVAHSARSSLTSSLMIDGLRVNVDKSANEIREELYRDYGVRLSYSQAYRAKEAALTELHGRTEDSYMVIPWICERLMETDPGTIARWECSDGNRFERLFIAYGCCIQGFIEGCRAILCIDGCHLSGPYKGTLLSACAYDADNELFPLAYAIVSGETHDEWAWFLLNLKEITRSMAITIVSDRNNAIITAVQEIFGSERHAFCYRHVKENYSSAYVKMNRGRRRTTENSKENALKLLDAIAYARHDHDFNVAMGNLRLFSPQLAQWVETQGDVDKWALSKFPFKRWDNITTNLAESFNAWMVKERKHTISVFIHEHQEKLAKKMLASKMGMTKWRNVVGPNIESKLMEVVRMAANIPAHYYGDNRISVETVSGNGGIISLNVDLGSYKCTCLAWQMSGIPCVHACAAIKLVHGNVYTFVDDCYKICSQEKIYAHSMRPIATHDCPRPDAPTVTEMLTQTFLQPPTTRRPPGRPKRKRIESQFQNKRIYHCGRCQEAGHSVKTCKNPNPS